MPTQQSSFWCDHCEQEVLGVRQSCNHILHAAVTLFLCGLWIPVWLIASFRTEPFRCQTCGGEQPRGTGEQFFRGLCGGAGLAILALVAIVLVVLVIVVLSVTRGFQ